MTWLTELSSHHTSRGRESDANSALVEQFSGVGGLQASTAIIEQIRDAVFNGMKPGDWLGTVPELADRFGVSRLTMRDAIRTLQAYGMVEVRVGLNGGVRVAKGNLHHFAETLAVQLHLLGLDRAQFEDVLAVLEPQSAHLAARRRSQVQVEQLRAAVLRQDKANAEGDEAEARRAEAEFHTLIAEASGNHLLFGAIQAIRVNGGYSRVPSELTSPNELIEMHRTILQAIEEQNTDSAARLMAEHVGAIFGHQHPR